MCTNFDNDTNWTWHDLTYDETIIMMTLMIDFGVKLYFLCVEEEDEKQVGINDKPFISTILACSAC